MEPVTFHLRTEVGWGTPTNTSGSPRPLLKPGLGIHTVHYTGIRPDQIGFSGGDGVFETIEDYFKFLRRLEEIARASGKPFEYNTMIPVMADNSSHVVAYADEYQAAHSAGENTISHGTQFSTGVDQDLNWGAVYAFQYWNAVLEATGRLIPDSVITPHKEMDGASTACPGPKIMGWMPTLRSPYVPPFSPPPIPPVSDKPGTINLATGDDVSYEILDYGIRPNTPFPEDQGLTPDGWWTEMGVTSRGLCWSGAPKTVDVPSHVYHQMAEALGCKPMLRIRNDAEMMQWIQRYGTTGPVPSTFLPNPTLTAYWKQYSNDTKG